TRHRRPARRRLGAIVAQVSAFDAPALEQSLRESRTEVVIDELTALPPHLSEMAAAAADDQRLRLEGGVNLHRAAQSNGVHRYIQQASGFFLGPAVGWPTSRTNQRSMQVPVGRRAPGRMPNSKRVL